MCKGENIGVQPIKKTLYCITIHLHIYAWVVPGRKMHTLTGLTACGGEWEAASCSTLSPVSGQWLPWAGQLAPRYHHVSWASPIGTVLLGGWYLDPAPSPLRNAVLLSGNTTTELFRLQYNTV